MGHALPMSEQTPRRDGDPTPLFDAIGELYDRVRPRYSEALFDDLLRESDVGPESFLLEIGSGTGIATLPVAARGHYLLGLEPAPRLVALLWQKLAAYPSATILETTFEAWEGRPGLFDLVYSAQAFHWLDPAERYAKSARQLRPGGTLALIGRNFQILDSEIAGALDRIYAEHAPSATPTSKTLWYAEDGPIPDEIAASGEFEPTRIRTYPERKRYSAEDYRAVLESFSDHQRLAAETRARLLDAVGEAIARSGGEIEVALDATLFLARRRDGRNST